MITEAQRVALALCITHWEHLRDRDPSMHPPYATNCECCTKFRETSLEEWEDCKECPIRQHTGQPYCRETPYWAASEEWDRAEGWSEGFSVLCGMEVAFLEEVLEEGDNE